MGTGLSTLPSGTESKWGKEGASLCLSGASCWGAGLRSPLAALSQGPTLLLYSKTQLTGHQAGLLPPGQWAHLTGLGLLEGAGHSCPQVTWTTTTWDKWLGEAWGARYFSAYCQWTPLVLWAMIRVTLLK